ncbi:hypothetical protein [Fulvivirga sp.]
MAHIAQKSFESEVNIIGFDLIKKNIESDDMGLTVFIINQKTEMSGQ